MITRRSLPSAGLWWIGFVLAAPALDAQMLLPRELELELATSALPMHLRDEATVYLYRVDQGLVVAKEGTNGFHAFVSRVDPAVFRADWEYSRHPEDVILPISFDAAGAEPQGPMQPFLDAAQLMARGSTPVALKREMARRFESGVYLPAARAGVSFMLSPLLRSYLNPLASDVRVTIAIPHRMFYAPYVTNADIGGDTHAGPQPFIIQAGKHGYMSQHAGPEEVSRIRASFASLVTKLCQFNSLLCQDGG